MKQRLLLSLASVGTLAVIAVWGTGAFFSDTETSADNIFTAGAVDLKVDSECHYNHLTGLTYKIQDNLTVPVPTYEDVGCEGFGTWASTDLDQEKFFNFSDVKPGDLGENTLSLTVQDNNAWACMYVEGVTNNENTRIEPEVEAGDATDDPDGGELLGYLRYSAWLDQGQQPGFQGKYNQQTNTGDKGEGDNVWQEPFEPLLFNNQSLSAAGTMLKIADSTTGTGPLTGGVTHYYGLAWCAGNLEMNGPGMGDTIYCNGEAMGNDAQTDSVTADVRFYVEQSRNNPDFVCPELEPEPIVFQLTNQDGNHNDNQAKGQPYVTWVINGDNIDFTFHNPTGIVQPFPFEYRIDDEAGAPIGGITGVNIPSGPYAGNAWGDFYNFVYVGPGSSSVINLTGSSKIQVRLVVGPERDYDFDWITFEAI